MDQQPRDDNVRVDGHHSGPSLSSSGPTSFPPAAATGERKSGSVRKPQSIPVTSEDEPQESQTPDQGSPAISEAEEWPSSAEQTLSIPMHQPQTSYSGKDALMHDAKHFILNADMLPRRSDVAHSFIHASEQPPITPESLAELDMPRIINNPKLRHDVNFDRELHFRPNLDGSKGRQKMRLADDYWRALEGELFLYGLVHQNVRQLPPAHSEQLLYWQGILTCAQKRLKLLFQAIRDILKTLVPDADQKAIEERLDVDLIMQEILRGMFDLIDLGNWLAKVIKNHCAPMRDGLVDAMQAEIRAGACEEQPARLVNGIRQLLGILEAMKLDVANHQIRHMRPLLVEDTVNFQRRYNQHRVEMGKIDIAASRRWLGNELFGLQTENPGTTHLEALTSALLRGIICAHSFSHSYPPTFYLDQDRLRALRNDLHAVIYHAICKEILLELCPKNTSPSALVKATTALQACVSAILGSAPGRIGTNAENISAEIMRLVLLVEGREGQFDHALADDAQERLEMDLRTESGTFERHARVLFERLVPKLQVSVEACARMTALGLQERLVPPPAAPGFTPLGFGAVCGPSLSAPSTDPDEDIIRRFTHISVLHWHVWAELAYLTADASTPPVSDSGDDSGFHGATTPPSSDSESSSPTVPVAQAVYAPGRKWLPIGVTVTEVPSQLPTPAPSHAGSPPAEMEEGEEGDSDISDGSEGDSESAMHSGASAHSI